MFASIFYILLRNGAILNKRQKAMFETFLQVFAGCSRLGQTAALQCIRLWELQRPGGDGSGEAWQPGGDGNFSNSSGLDSASRRVNNLSNTEYIYFVI